MARRPAAPVCPWHYSPLTGGAILFNCPEGHSVYAADLDIEYRPPAVTR